MSKSSTLPELYLASTSPRRRQLLEGLGLQFQVLSIQSAEKSATIGDLEQVIAENALLKASVPAPAKSAEDAVVIGADTLVAVGDRVLEKPRDPKELLEFLDLLSGRSHRVLTGLACVSRKYGARSRVVESTIWLRALPTELRHQYSLTREPYDKSGGYAIQGLGSLFVERIEGSYTNIIGLPIEALLEELGHLTGVLPYQWFIS